MFLMAPPSGALSPYGVYKAWDQTGLLSKISWICDHENVIFIRKKEKRGEKKQQVQFPNNQILVDITLETLD